MKTLKLEIKLTYDAWLMHADNEEGYAWFINEVLLNTTEEGKIVLHSNEIGDEVGTVEVTKIIEI